MRYKITFSIGLMLFFCGSIYAQSKSSGAQGERMILKGPEPKVSKSNNQDTVALAGQRLKFDGPVATVKESGAVRELQADKPKFTGPDPQVIRTKRTELRNNGISE